MKCAVLFITLCSARVVCGFSQSALINGLLLNTCIGHHGMIRNWWVNIVPIWMQVPLLLLLFSLMSKMKATHGFCCVPFFFFFFFFLSFFKKKQPFKNAESLLGLSKTSFGSIWLTGHNRLTLGLYSRNLLYLLYLVGENHMQRRMTVSLFPALGSVTSHGWLDVGQCLHGLNWQTLKTKAWSIICWSSRLQSDAVNVGNANRT